MSVSQSFTTSYHVKDKPYTTTTNIELDESGLRITCMTDYSTFSGYSFRLPMDDHQEAVQAFLSNTIQVDQKTLRDQFINLVIEVITRRELSGHRKISYCRSFYKDLLVIQDDEMTLYVVLRHGVDQNKVYPVESNRELTLDKHGSLDFTLHLFVTFTDIYVQMKTYNDVFWGRIGYQSHTPIASEHDSLSWVDFRRYILPYLRNSPLDDLEIKVLKTQHEDGMTQPQWVITDETQPITLEMRYDDALSPQDESKLLTVRKLTDPHRPYETFGIASNQSFYTLMKKTLEWFERMHREMYFTQNVPQEVLSKMMQRSHQNYRTLSRNCLQQLEEYHHHHSFIRAYREVSENIQTYHRTIKKHKEILKLMADNLH